MFQNLHHRVLIVALAVFIQDLSSGGGALAWTYNYSITPNRRWLDARQWCQQHFTDVVAFQSKEETDFLNNLLPFNTKYYWVGVLNMAGVWTSVGTGNKVPEDSQNWAPGEPNNIGQDCVEIYIKRDTDTAKWNNEKCRSKKGTVCYTVSCAPDSCSAHADCVETIGNYTCQCHPGFHGPRCEEAIACKPFPGPEHSFHQCFDPYGSNHLNSSCHFRCELGFRLVGAPQLFCQTNGHWDHPVPLCQVEQCPALNHTTINRGDMNCSHPIAPYCYNSTCEVTCDEGYELSGEGKMHCDHTGQWTTSVPTCEIKKCSPIVFPVTGNMTCVDTQEPFSFGSRCDFTCQEGYYLTGDNSLTCLASGQWSKHTPACTVVQCNSLDPPSHASMQCQGPLGEYSYGSKCGVQCVEGFDLIGTNITKCSSRGSWSHSLPVCQAKRCPALNSAPHGFLSCSDLHGKFSFGSQCMSTCEEGFLLNGTRDTKCTSEGTWSADIPHCFAKRCSSLNPPSHGSFSCSDPHGEFSFGSRCELTCEEGFVLNGTADTECTPVGMWSREIAHCLARPCPLLAKAPQHGRMNCSHPYSPFSFDSHCDFECDEGFWLRGAPAMTCNNSGHWSQDLPTCQPKRCSSLNSPSHGSFSCSDPHGEFSFGSRCELTCEEGFVLNGTADTECTPVGMWSREIAHCLARPCPLLAKAPHHGRMNCSHPYSPFSFDSHCDFECDEGFQLSGAPAMTCNNSGHWSQDLPTCQPKRCSSLNPPSHGSFSCSDPHGEFSFGSRCELTCEEGFVLNGTADTECTPVGMWSREIAHCLARPCPLLAKAPQHGRMNCSHPYSPFSFDSHCDFECDEGFQLRGAPAMTCNNSGHWSQDLPNCQPVQCEAIQPLPLTLSMNCSHPLGNFSFGSQCLFTCKDGFFLNGTEVLLCSSAGIWSNSLPDCTEDMPLGTAMLMNTGVGAASVVLPLVLLGLALLFLIRFKKRGQALAPHDSPSWEERENPAFEF